ncbi:MAG: hypothetical protein ACPGVG_08705 [Mycobacterium sp.]
MSQPIRSKHRCAQCGQIPTGDTVLHRNATGKPKRRQFWCSDECWEAFEVKETMLARIAMEQGETKHSEDLSMRAENALIKAFRDDGWCETVGVEGEKAFLQPRIRGNEFANCKHVGQRTYQEVRRNYKLHDWPTTFRAAYQGDEAE